MLELFESVYCPNLIYHLCKIGVGGSQGQPHKHRHGVSILVALEIDLAEAQGAILEHNLRQYPCASMPAKLNADILPTESFFTWTLSPMASSAIVTTPLPFTKTPASP